jgi:predicted DCC family thiol-disulfide oxidoreductase YuxK
MRPDWTPVSADDPEWQDVILFDGVCVFCSRWVAFVIARDDGQRFRFAPVQSAFGGDMADRFGIDRLAPQTNAVIISGMAYFKADGAIEVLRLLPGWSWVRLLSVLPRRLRNLGYDLIASNRYRLFGRLDSCMVPSPDVRGRFILDSVAQ